MNNRLNNLSNLSVVESDYENQVNQKQIIEKLQTKTFELGERVKELNCLYTISHLVEKPDVTLAEIFQGTVNIIPPSWQYPEITCAKITVENNEYTTDNYLETEWLQQCDIIKYEQIVGSIEIYYLRKMPEFEEGTFLKEERSLINAISERLSSVIEQDETKKELQKTYAELELRVEKRTAELAQANKLLEIDLIKRKQAEEALRESEEKFRALVETTGDLVWEVDSEAIFTYVSPQSENILGYKPKELIGKSGFTLMQHREKNRFGKVYKDLKEECKPFIREETINYHKDGSLIILESNGTATLDDNGNVTGYRGVARDITKRKQFEEQRNTERERAQAYLDISGVIFVALDESGIVTLANQKTCEILGYTEEEVIGKNWFDNFLPLHLRESVKEVSRQLMQGKIKPVEYFENPVLTKNGVERTVAWHNTILKDNNGLIIGSLSSGEDITERMQAEEVLKASEEKFLKIFQINPSPITITSLESGKIVDVNSSFEKVFGYSKEEVLGKTTLDLDLWSCSEERNRFKEALLVDENLNNIEMKFKRKDGKQRLCLFSCTLVHFDSKPHIVLIALDITERKLQRVALETTNKQLANEKTLLKNKNIALHEVLDRIEDQKEEIKFQLHKNINNVVLPMLEPLKRATEPSFINMVNLLESSLSEIMSPLVDRLENLYAKLTPREIEICNLIKSGLDSKEIAENLYLSVNTIHTQRRRIRKKLGINDNKTNLTNYLKSI